jgi:hypothetical protein
MARIESEPPWRGSDVLSGAHVEQAEPAVHRSGGPDAFSRSASGVVWSRHEVPPALTGARAERADRPLKRVGSLLDEHLEGSRAHHDLVADHDGRSRDLRIWAVVRDRLPPQGSVRALQAVQSVTARDIQEPAANCRRGHRSRRDLGPPNHPPGPGMNRPHRSGEVHEIGVTTLYRRGPHHTLDPVLRPALRQPPHGVETDATLGRVGPRIRQIVPIRRPPLNAPLSLGFL